MMTSLTTPVLTASSTGLTTMSPAMLEARNYYQWITAQLEGCVGQRILDVGGGTGSLIRFFLDREKLFALDISEECVAYLQKAYEVHDHVRTILGDVTESSLQSFFKDEVIDTILCTNVLEHVETDEAMLKSFYEILSPVQGKLAILVPAHQWLYGTLDEAAGHYRRYTKRQLQHKLENAGFKVEKLCYMNMAATVGWWLNGLCFKQKKLDATSVNQQILLYDKFIIPLVRNIESIVPIPFGLSVIAIGHATVERS
jgi:2-polyprenyl-3-methyl-5-hydroxy-6-metoxy-1,4-benzoquinol methylase